MIYAMILDGKTPSGIASSLTRRSVPSPAGKPTWTKSTVLSILSNEKYKGDVLLQKSFTVDFLSKKKMRNEGEIPSYYIKNSHPDIVSEGVFDMVQHGNDSWYVKARTSSGWTDVNSGSASAGKSGSGSGNSNWIGMEFSYSIDPTHDESCLSSNAGYTISLALAQGSGSSDSAL